MLKTKDLKIKLFAVLIIALLSISFMCVYADNNMKEPTDEQIMKAREKYEYGYQKKYCLEDHDYFPHRLNNYEFINYGTISYEEVVNDLLGYKCSDIQWKTENIETIMYDNIEHNLKNGTISKDGVLYAEIKDIAEMLNSSVDFRLYIKDKEKCVIGALLEKYDKKMEICLIKNENTEYDLEYKNVKVIPGAIIEEDVNETYHIIKDGLIYVPLENVLRFFHYDMEYNELASVLKINNNDKRDDLTWNEIYINAINDAVESGQVSSFALMDVTGDEIPEVFFELGKAYFNFETANLGICGLMPSPENTDRFYCFWYNDSEKKLEIKADSIRGWFITDNEIALNRMVFEGTASYSEKCNWEKDVNDFSYELMSSIPNELNDFDTYNTDDILSGNISAENIIERYENGDKPVSFISYDEWAKKYIDAAIELEILADDMQKDYKNKITREEFADMLVRLFLKIQEKSFDEYINENNISLNDNLFIDTKNESILLAYNLGIINGIGNNKFAPEKYITRQETAVILNNFCNILGISKDFYDIQKYEDDSKIADWAKDSVYAMTDACILYGVGIGKFNPLGTFTRQEAIVTACRIYIMS